MKASAISFNTFQQILTIEHLAEFTFSSSTVINGGRWYSGSVEWAASVNI
jgi:hypothetical protein